MRLRQGRRDVQECTDHTSGWWVCGSGWRPGIHAVVLLASGVPRSAGTTEATRRRLECAELLSCDEGSSRANIVAEWSSAKSRRREFGVEYRRRIAKPPGESPEEWSRLIKMGRSSTEDQGSLLLEECSKI